MRSNYTILAVFTIFASRSLRSNCTILAVFTIFARVTFEIRVALQGILIQGYQDAFVSFCAHFFCFQAVAEVKLQAADGRSGYKAAGRVAAAAPFATAVDVDGQAGHTLQLGHVHGVGIRKPGRHARDLAGMGPIAYRNRCPGRFPGLVSRFAGTLLQRIIAFHVFIRNSHGPAAQGHATIHFHVGIVADEDGVGSRGGQFLIRIADNHIVGLFSSNHMRVANDRVAVGFVVYCVVGADDFSIAYVGCRILVAVQHVEFTDGAAGPGQAVAHTHELRILGIVRFVAATNGQRGTAGKGSLSHSIADFLSCGSHIHLRRTTNGNRSNGIVNFVAGAQDQSSIGVSRLVGQPDDVVGYTGHGIAGRIGFNAVQSTNGNSPSILRGIERRE